MKRDNREPGAGDHRQTDRSDATPSTRKVEHRTAREEPWLPSLLGLGRRSADRDTIGGIRTETSSSASAANRLIELAQSLREEADRDGDELGPPAEGAGGSDAREGMQPGRRRHTIVEQRATFAQDARSEGTATSEATGQPDRTARGSADVDATKDPGGWAQIKAKEMLELPRDERVQRPRELVREANLSCVPLVALEALASTLIVSARNEADRILADNVASEVRDTRKSKLARWATEANRLSDDELRQGLARFKENRKAGTDGPDDSRREQFYRSTLERRRDERLERFATEMPFGALQQTRVHLHGRWRETGDAVWKRMFDTVDRVYQQKVEYLLRRWARELGAIGRNQVLVQLRKTTHGKRHLARIRRVFKEVSAEETSAFVAARERAREQQREHFNRTHPALRGDFFTALVTWSTGNPDLGYLMGGLFGGRRGGRARGGGPRGMLGSQTDRRTAAPPGGTRGPAPPSTAENRSAPPVGSSGGGSGSGADDGGGGRVPRRTATSTSRRTEFHRPSDPVVEHAKSKTPPDDLELRGRLASEVHEARGAQERAAKARDRLGTKHPEKTTAVGRQTELKPGVHRRQSRISGWTSIPERRVSVDPRTVADRAKHIGHRLQPGGVRDGKPEHGGFAGKAAASHAEKQQIVARPNEPVGVSKPMCADCVRFFQKEAVARKRGQVVGDPDVTRVFGRDGSITEYWQDGMRVHRSADGKSVKVRPPKSKR